MDFAALSVAAVVAEGGALMGVESEIAEQVGLADDYIIQRFDFLLRVLLDVEVDSVMKHPKMTFSAQLKCRIEYMFDLRRIKKLLNRFREKSGYMISLTDTGRA